MPEYFPIRSKPTISPHLFEPGADYYTAVAISKSDDFKIAAISGVIIFICDCCHRLCAVQIDIMSRRGKNMQRTIRSHRLPVFFFFALVCSSLSAYAADVSLAWDPSTSTDVVGYRVHYGSSSGSYGNFHTVGNQTTYTVSNLSNGTYYFAVTAFDTEGNESTYSNEVSAVLGPPAQACDVNGDTSVNTIDIQAMVNIILGINSSGNEPDLNSDTRVDVLDLQILNNVVLGLRNCP